MRLTLAEQLWRIWRRLGPHWSSYFKLAGLDLEAATVGDFEERLRRLIDVNFTLAGLEELSRQASRGIEPGDPARSLFYHVFASPHVNPTGISDNDYPTMGDLEIIENYVFSAAAQSIDSLLARAHGSELAIVVFAYEYAVAIDTVHGRHADLTFARTGIGRVGNASPNYIPKARGFFPHSSGDRVHVVPARFGVFIASQRQGNRKTIGPMRFNSGDGREKFWIPLHKLFNGTECIADQDLRLSIETRHINQKIKKVHLALQSEGIDTGWNAAQMQLTPFVIVDDLANFEPMSSHVVSVPHDPLVAPACTSEGRLVGFPVPPSHDQMRGALWFPQDLDGRPWPEFVHAKHEIVTCADGRQQIRYLPETDPRKIDDVVRAGGYEAANFVDWTAEGWVSAHCPALDAYVRKQLSAYSILAQPDFFPLVKQQDVMKWWEESAPDDIKYRIWPDQGITPAPLSDARYPANFTLTGAFFDSTDRTMTAIIGMDRKPGPKSKLIRAQPRRESTLSYRATNLFEPGWDSSEDFHRDNKAKLGTYHLANYGLGSPYPEDTLICAAYGSYWPAAVPDATRFFAPNTYPSTTPILDEEALWDGVPLPATENDITQYRTLSYVDYVQSIMQGKLRYGEFAEVTLDEYISRTAATARVFQFLDVSEPTDRRKFPFLSFRNPIAAEMQLLNKSGWKVTPDRTYRVEVAQFVGLGNSSPSQPEVTPVTLTKFLVLYTAAFAIAHQDLHDPGTWHVRRF